MSQSNRSFPLTASWWRLQLHVRPAFRLLGAGLVTSGCAELAEEAQPPATPQTSLEAQQEHGWNVESEGAPLALPNPQTSDVEGGAAWQTAQLSLELAPGQARWTPYYDPTLFQSLDAPRNADLRALMRPILTPGMAVANRRGGALVSLFVDDRGLCRNDVAIVLDIDGPEAVAVAAALAPCFEPVFLFDNWPHPLGVVPSHLTLAAALYYLPAFESGRGRRAGDAAPVFVVDRKRLSPYSDAAGLFDNRYTTALPPRAALEAAGIRHVLYVTPSAEVTMDSDDLNQDLVELDRAGIDVKMLAMTDFADTPPPGWLDPQQPAPPQPPSQPVAVSLPQFYFGGSPTSHRCFWRWYGWPPCHGQPVPPAAAERPMPLGLAPRAQFRPALRPAWAASFHGMPVRGNPAMGARPGMSGMFRGTPTGAFNRSGSMGRFHGGGFSG
jgi:hypothetical protein